jgi:hypothetical protein
MEKAQIKVSLRPSFGKGRYYPENDAARAILLVAGQLTFTEEQLNILVDVGKVFEIVVVDVPKDGFKREIIKKEKKSE